MDLLPAEILEQIWKHIPYPLRGINLEIDNLLNSCIWASSSHALRCIDNNFDNLIRVFPSQPQLFELVVTIILDDYKTNFVYSYNIEREFNIDDIYDLITSDTRYQKMIKAHKNLRRILNKVARKLFPLENLFPSRSVCVLSRDK